MKQSKESIPSSSHLLTLILGLLSLVGLIYNFSSYLYLQRILVPSLAQITPAIDRISIGLVISLLVLATYHLVLLFFTLRLISAMQQRFFLGAAWLVFVILSGILIFSDIAILSDQGKEYLYWDISRQWTILYIQTAYHFVVVAAGFLLQRLQPVRNQESLFSTIRNDEGTLFYILHLVGLISGTIGVSITLIPQIIQLEYQYRNAWLITLAMVAVLPFLSFLLYWLIRKRGSHGTILLDEKQSTDMGKGGLAALLVSFIFLVTFIFLQNLHVIDLDNNLYIIFLIFTQLIIYTGMVSIRNGLVEGIFQQDQTEMS